MVLARCKRCGAIFQKVIDRDLCPLCLEKEEEEFRKVKEFFRQHPKARLEEVSEATGVDKKVILEFLKEGRLQIAEGIGPVVELFCERCGKPIVSGRLCDECRRKVAQLIQNTGEKKSRGPDFYFKDVLWKKGEKD
ncbi:MAG: MerR family transcriptional regulator [Candidatus Caldatribacterium sp.]|uniref:MerR family transcriptional regulator n=1 Tax=Candidatus Caldatribacterium sp. TaxID=2282143 RepID=UPI002998E36F|nr:MerR family transcriptional regulator [Candidatus Caldatribacterium sp.]MCX7729672.1 MerR family transcriptional regulator [Candidatus Caldatribacterium sp.]MDW8081948.1 MerR family transcriptional regulator [Candidatus Calescibacterium sp.]